jgi:hypothetical protein
MAPCTNDFISSQQNGYAPDRDNGNHIPMGHLHTTIEAHKYKGHQNSTHLAVTLLVLENRLRMQGRLTVMSYTISALHSVHAIHYQLTSRAH